MDTLVHNQKQKIVVIVGPTSSGKTALSIDLARNIGGEVISADSRQVYKGLDIGTGKVTRSEMKGIRHHLLDVASPKKVFTAADFVARGREALEDIVRRGKTPIICGGTGFYIDALLGRISLPDVPANSKLRARLEKKSASQLYAMLKKMDPRRAKNIDRKNPVRLVRAIEIAKALGKVPLPSIDLRGRYSSIWIGLKPDDKTLRKKIHARLLDRMRHGMVAEAKILRGQGLSYKRMDQLGLEYRYLSRFLQNNISKDDMLRDLERDIWHYARRQMTYWRKNGEIEWFSGAKEVYSRHRSRLFDTK
ncbi:tRNA (adenosine(37)-N6)-dimethylallyltransferase MiaA [Candidatus Kaiserbacteria bacterium]|nr:tRNA (adenosine(37)-N6)-dimethylallyltransferase MiaA [Candidatus Kaiserbacteria bacterium]